MKDEIKEILDEFESLFEVSEVPEHIINGFNKIKDYITNLQEKYKKSCETYQQALDETMSKKMDLQVELDRCVKANIILDNENTELANNYVLTEYVDEMTKLKDENKSNINRIHELEEELDSEYVQKEYYKSRCEKAIEKLDKYINSCEIGAEQTLNNEKCLISVRHSKKVKNILNGGADNE